MKNIAAILILAIVLISGCTESAQQEPAPQTTVEERKVTETTHVPQGSTIGRPVAETTTLEITTSAKPSSSLKTNKVHEIDMIAKKYSFKPSEIRVRQGDIVKLHITSTDVGHGMSIKEYDIRVGVPAGETKTVEFTADKKGTFTYYCSVYCGSGHGQMKGKLIVE